MFVKICGREIRVRGRLLRIAELEGDSYVFLDSPDPIINSLRRCGVRVDLFTFIQRLPDTSRKYDYPMEQDNLAVLPVSTFEHWWAEQIGFKARNKARQAERKGVEVRRVPFDDALVRGVWQVYNETTVRQGRANIHYGKDLKAVYAEVATFLDKSIFIGAFYAGQLIGFAKLVHDETRTQANLMNIVSMVRYRDKAPTNALIAQAVRCCAEMKIPYLVYSRFVYGKKQRDGIIDFKERNGFKRVDLPRYYVPLTSIGRVALRLGLHHRMRDRLPESLAVPLRDLRSAWYSRKFRSVREVY